MRIDLSTITIDTIVNYKTTQDAVSVAGILKAVLKSVDELPGVPNVCVVTDNTPVTETP